MSATDDLCDILCNDQLLYNTSHALCDQAHWQLDSDPGEFSNRGLWIAAGDLIREWVEAVLFDVDPRVVSVSEYQFRVVTAAHFVSDVKWEEVGKCMCELAQEAEGRVYNTTENQEAGAVT